MVNGIKILSNKKMSLKNNFIEYLNPEYVYIPLISNPETNISIFVKNGDYVYKGSLLGKSKGNFSLPILSSVSGIVCGTEEKFYLNGKKIKCIVIKNDFKELSFDKPFIVENIEQIKKDKFIEILKNNAIVGMGGANFPTYIKYSTNSEIKTLIVNAVECEPYITADYVLIIKCAEKILECINAILKINGIDEAYIAIKKSNTKLIDAFSRFIGTYPNIKIHETLNIYPMGWEKNVVESVLNKTYDKLPIEIGVVVNNVSTIYAIYESIKYNKPLISRIVTFTGEGFESAKNINVKIGSSVKEVIEKNLKYKNTSELLFIAGGPMMGNSIPSDDIIVTPNLNCVLVIPKNKKLESINCLRCGLCMKYCPAKLTPVLIKDNLNNSDKLKIYQVNRCIECGLCSFVCPSKINVRDFVRRAKEIIREEQK